MHSGITINLCSIKNKCYLPLAHHDNDILHSILQVESVDPACEQDYLLVHDVSAAGDLTLLERHCYSNPPEGPHFSSWDRMSISFFTDGTTESTGFFAQYKSMTFDLSEDLLVKILYNG